MRTIDLHGNTGDSSILIGEKLQNLTKYISLEKTVIVTDANVWKYYRHNFPPCSVIKIGMGERIKNLDTLRNVYSELLALGADRSTFIVGIGGGIVCDITGFVASTYMRGVRFGFVSTTLLSQVDASVGGKNGVNFNGYKNIVGIFNQPDFVICDNDLLRTLPEKELLSGFAEIVKHGAVEDAQLFAYMENHYEEAIALDPEVMEKLIYDSIIIKSSIVSKDEKEKGERRKLNFGHTFGHAMEKIARVSHGEAVSAGMAIAAALSVRKGLLSKKDEDRLLWLLSKLKLPTYIRVDREKMLDALRKDKKREGDQIHFVLLRDIGHALVTKMPLKELEAAADALSSRPDRQRPMGGA